MIAAFRGTRRLRRAGVRLVALAQLAALGCASRPETAPWSCRDEGNARECSSPLAPPSAGAWTCYAAGGELVCALPTRAAAGPGWRCAAAGPATVCRRSGGATPDEPAPDGWQARVDGDRVVALWRRAGNAPWRCEGDACLERRPDRPSADEWECVEGDGRVLCRGRFLVGIDPRWICVPLGERFLCLDPDPDYPGEGAPADWRCYYDDSLRTGRVCRPAPAPAGEQPPDAGSSCPGTWIGVRCLPTRVRPECWLDGDCAGGRSCRVGFCVTASGAARRR